MPDYWMTTHWPTPPGLSRHVYIKDRRVTVPAPGDIVFIREAIVARDKDGRRIRKVDRHHRGEVVKGIDVPEGDGGIIGLATVEGAPRSQQADDVVYDFGDLREWSVIPCGNFRAARLSLAELRTFLRRENVRGMNLWLIPDELGSKLMSALRS